MKKHIENKKQVQQHMATRGKGAGATKYSPDEDADDGRKGRDSELDALWARIRDFLNDLTASGEKRDIRGVDRPNKLRLTEACAVYDEGNKGVISKRLLVQAFTTARLTPALSDREWDKLLSALEAWDHRETQTVLYRRLLEATYMREQVSVHGIFPKVPAREPSKFELDRKAKAEEEERKALEAAEEERMKRELAQSKRLASSGAAGASSKEGLKRSQKEEQLLKEAEKKEADRRRQVEEEAIRKDVGQLKSAVASIQAKAKKQGESVRKWFNLFDLDRNN